MKKEKLKSNCGISMTDIIIGVFILTLFVGVIGNFYYQIALQSKMIHLNAIAVYYCVKIAEDIDRMGYEKVTNELNNTLKDTYKIPDSFTIAVEVENYNEMDSAKKEDILKIVTIKAEYQCFDDTRTYELRKVKVKEM